MAPSDKSLSLQVSVCCAGEESFLSSASLALGSLWPGSWALHGIEQRLWPQLTRCRWHPQF